MASRVSFIPAQSKPELLGSGDENSGDCSQIDKKVNDLAIQQL